MPSFQELMTQQLHTFGKLVNFEEPLPGVERFFTQIYLQVYVPLVIVLQAYKYETSAYQCDLIGGRTEESDRPSQSQRGA